MRELLISALLPLFLFNPQVDNPGRERVEVKAITQETRQRVTKPPKKQSKRTLQSSRSGGRKVKAIITAYCSDRECTGKDPSDPYYGITASGKPAKEGITLAGDRAIPFGTSVYIPGVGTREIQDRGGRNTIVGNHFDLYFDSHAEALAWGKRHIEITIND